MSAPHIPHAITCDEVEDLLPLVVDGVIDEQCEPDLYAHLATCACCQQSLSAYDVIDLALSGGRDLQPAHKHPQIIHYRIPRLWTFAASLLLAGAFGLWVAQTGTPSASMSQSALNTVVNDRENGNSLQILEVLPAVPGQDQPVFVVQDGNTVRVISGSQLDGGNQALPPATATAVSNERYPQQIRQVGSID